MLLSLVEVGTDSKSEDTEPLNAISPHLGYILYRCHTVTPSVREQAGLNTLEYFGVPKQIPTCRRKIHMQCQLHIPLQMGATK